MCAGECAHGATRINPIHTTLPPPNVPLPQAQLRERSKRIMSLTSQVESMENRLTCATLEMEQLEQELSRLRTRETAGITHRKGKGKRGEAWRIRAVQLPTPKTSNPAPVTAALNPAPVTLG